MKKKWVTSLLALSLVSSLSAGPVFADGGHGKKNGNGNHYGWYKQKINFVDIDDSFSWARQAIERLAQEGIIRGMDDNHFQPAGKLDRAQFAVLVSRFFGLQPASTTQEDFRDVHNGDWYFRDIEAAKDYMTMFINPNGGYDFKPEQPINRAEAAVTLVQLLLKSNSIQLVSQSEANQILSVYKDENLIPVNLRVHVATAVKAGVIKGVAHDRFDPLTTLNRAQAATLLYRLQTDLSVLPIDPTTGEPIEIVPGQPDDSDGTDNTAPTISYRSASYNVTAGDEIIVRTNERGAVYLIPSSYSPTTRSALDNLINDDIGVKYTVGTANTDVTLDTTDLATGNYVVYATDLDGNVSKLNRYVYVNSVNSGDTTAPTLSYRSDSYNLNVGDSVTVRSSEMGAVFLVPIGYTPDTISELDSLYTARIAAKSIVTQINTNIALNTTNLAAGDYRVYAVDLSGNVSHLSNTVHLQ